MKHKLKIHFSVLTIGLLLVTIFIIGLSVLMLINRAVNHATKTELIQAVDNLNDMTQMALQIILNKNAVFLESMAAQNDKVPFSEEKLEAYLFHQRRKHQFEFFVIKKTDQTTLSAFLPSSGLDNSINTEIKMTPQINPEWRIFNIHSKTILCYIVPIFNNETGEQIMNFYGGISLNQNNAFYSELSRLAHVNNVSVVFRDQLLGAKESLDKNEMQIIQDITKQKYRSGLYQHYIFGAQLFPVLNREKLYLYTYNKAGSVFSLSTVLYRDLIIIFSLLGIIIIGFSVLFVKLITSPLKHLIAYAKGLAQNQLNTNFNPGIILEIDQLSQHLKQNVFEIVKSREHIQRISDNLVDGFVYQIDSGDENNVRKFTYISAGVQNILGITPEQVYENAFVIYQMISPEDSEEMQMKETDAIKSSILFKHEAWFIAANGQRKCLFLNSSPHTNDIGHIIWDGIAMDVTKRRLAEIEVQNTLRKLEDLHFIVNHSPAYAFIWKAEINWPVKYVSENIQVLLGYSANDFLSGKKVFSDMVHPDDLQKMNTEIENNIARGLTEYNQEYRVVGKNGDVHWVDDRTWVKKDEQGEIVYFQGILLDVTARKLAEEKQAKLTDQLFHSQKMDAIGQLAGGVAHDFNNVLAAIMGSAEMLKMDTFPKEKQLDFINVIITAAKRAGELTRKLLTFSRKGIKASTPVDCLKIVSDTVSLLKHTLNKNINITMETKASLFTIIGDDSLIQNALVNIGINASHAMPDGGSLHFILENLELDEEYCKNTTFDINPGTFLEISVRDTGFGMSPEVLSRIFEPFFTTKSQGKGTGLGLAMVYGMIQEHNGAITVYSEVGTGTVFHIYLPVVQENVYEPENVQEIVPGSGTILIIDDEELIRITASAILNSLGYQVILAENGEDGISLFRDNSDKIDLILLDMIMPVMGGRETFKHIREISETVPVIIASGFAKEEDMRALKKQGVSGFLHKPFRRADLADMIAKSLQKS